MAESDASAWVPKTAKLITGRFELIRKYPLFIAVSPGRISGSSLDRRPRGGMVRASNLRAGAVENGDGRLGRFRIGIHQRQTGKVDLVLDHLGEQRLHTSDGNQRQGSPETGIAGISEFDGPGDIRRAA